MASLRPITPPNMDALRPFRPPQNGGSSTEKEKLMEQGMRENQSSSKKMCWSITKGIVSLLLIALVIITFCMVAYLVHQSNQVQPIANNAQVLSVGKPSPPPVVVPPTIPPLPVRKIPGLGVLGAGVSGLVTALRAAPYFGANLVMIDERSKPGGKIQSKRLTIPVNSSYSQNDLNIRPVFTPTHAEQLRNGDAIMRCISQEMGTVMVKRPGVGTWQEDIYNNPNGTGRFNSTGWLCFGNGPKPTVNALCALDKFGIGASGFGASSEGPLPNGWGNLSNYFGNLPNFCGDLNFTQCNYEDEYIQRLIDPKTAKTVLATESFYDYTVRILGVAAANYMRTYSLGYADYVYADDQSAKWALDFITYDYNYPYGHLSVPHGGPQMTHLRIAQRIIDQGSEIRLDEKVVSLSNTIGVDSAAFPFNVTTNKGIYLFERLIPAFPAPVYKTLGGDLAATIATNMYVKYLDAVPDCTFNAFFPTKWWDTIFGVDSCNTGRCSFRTKFSLNATQQPWRQYQRIELGSSPNSVGFTQFIATPERKEGNLLRFFPENQALCERFTQMSEVDIMREMMRRVRANAPPGTASLIPDPVQYYFGYDRNSYVSVKKGALFSPSDVHAYASAPIAGKNLCLAGDSFAPEDLGWQEAAARTAHRCLRSPVFADKFAPSVVTKFESCTADFNQANQRQLALSNSGSLNDVCLLLKNEYHTRDLANLSFCGGPKNYDYPTFTELTQGSYVTTADWSLTTQVQVLDDQGVGRGRRAIKMA